MIYVVAVVGGIILIGLLVKAVDSSQRTCPSCQAPGSFSKLFLRQCKACSAWVVREGGAWKAVGPGYVHKIAQFPAFLEDLKPPPRWQMPWPGCCSVCKQTTAMSTTVSFTGAIVGVVGPYVTKEKYSFEFYHCPVHLEPARFQQFSSIAVPGREGDNLEFKSFDFWQEFLRLNRK
ncbi:MAG TPA: hypothetical protein VEN81_10205 [Planctomycetota bacterium]|nr:hypothetical protein [Planctomycetota bacterium]